MRILYLRFHPAHSRSLSVISPQTIKQNSMSTLLRSIGHRRPPFFSPGISLCQTGNPSFIFTKLSVMHKAIVLFLLFVFHQATVTAQYTQEWFVINQQPLALIIPKVKKILSAGDHLYLLATVQGNPVNDEDVVLMKYGKDGSLMWEKRYAVPGNFKDEAVDMELDDWGNIYVACKSAPAGLKTAVDFCTIKYSQDGSQSWVQRWGTGQHAEEICGLKVRNGMVFVSGKSVHTAGPATAEDYHSKIYNAENGREIWSHSWNGPGNDWRNYPAAMTIDNMQNLIVVGSSEHPDYDYAVIRYKWDTLQPQRPTDSAKIALVLDWERWHNGSDNGYDNAMFVTTNKAGDIYITGESYSKGGKQDIATVKYDKKGNQIWERRLNGTFNNRDQPIGIALDSKENIIVSGNLQNLRPSKMKTKETFCTIKYSPDGDSLWTTAWSNIGGFTTKMQVMAVDRDDHVITGGATAPDTPEPYLRKLDPDGKIVWEARIKNQDGSLWIGELHAMHIDIHGNLYFTGLHTSGQGAPKLFITKFAKN